MEDKSSKFNLDGLKRLFPYIFIFLVIAIGYAGAYYYYSKYQEINNQITNPDEATLNEVKEVTQKLGKIYLLPEDEIPTVATVIDKTKLDSQPFFEKAENGDKVVIYENAKLAILYRISQNKIINVSPVTLDQAEEGSLETQDQEVETQETENLNQEE